MCLNKNGCAMVVRALIMSLGGVYINVDVKRETNPIQPLCMLTSLFLD